MEGMMKVERKEETKTKDEVTAIMKELKKKVRKREKGGK